MRRHLSFLCEDARLFATLDLPETGAMAGAAGLLLVSGGNEIRAGAWNGQALLAARIAARGHPVLRFDRRGVGESEGANRGFRQSAPDIAAALRAFRAEAPGLGAVVGLGNCDAASALMLGGGCGLDGLVLTNPWTFEDEAGGGETGSSPAPAPAALRAHYWRRLTDPAALLRLVKGKVSLPGLLASLRDMARPGRPSTLAADMARGMAGFSGPVRILLAGRDRTADAFAGQWDRADPRLFRCPGASHSFVEPEAQDWLAERITGALGELSPRA